MLDRIVAMAVGMSYNSKVTAPWTHAHHGPKLCEHRQNLLVDSLAESVCVGTTVCGKLAM